MNNLASLVRFKLGVNLKVECTKNKAHKRFLTTAHVMQEWVVDEYGEYIRTTRNGQCLEVTAEPDPDNAWTCEICGADAQITQD